MDVIDKIKSNYSHIFDFKDDFVLGKYSFKLYARYNQENSKCFISPKTKIYSYSNNEHIFFKEYSNSSIDFDEINEFFKFVYNDFIEVDENHMSSIITLICFVSEVDDASKKLIKKFKFDKSYSFGLKGFVKGKLIVFDTFNNVAYENKLALGDAKKFGFFD